MSNMESNTGVDGGINNFPAKGQEFAKAITSVAVQVRDQRESTSATHAALMVIVEAVLSKRKTDPETVDDQVFAFCMAWMAGAITFNTGQSWKTKALISFLAGAATVVAFRGLA